MHHRYPTMQIPQISYHADTTDTVPCRYHTMHHRYHTMQKPQISYHADTTDNRYPTMQIPQIPYHADTQISYQADTTDTLPCRYHTILVCPLPDNRQRACYTENAVSRTPTARYRTDPRAWHARFYGHYVPWLICSYDKKHALASCAAIKWQARFQHREG